MFRIDTKGNSKRARIDEPDNEEQLLESIVFRDSKSVLNNLKEKQLVQERKGIQLDEDSEEDLNEEQISFIIDNQGDQELLEKTKDVSQSTAAVWQDDDDDIGFDEVYKKVHKRPKKFGAEHKFKDYLEHKFKSLHPQPEWATKLAATGKVRTEDDDGEDLERVAGDVTTGQFRLDSSSLNYKTCGSIDRVESGKGSYRSIDFHPLDSYIILSKREYVTLYHLNERNSKRVKNIKFDDFMIEQATIRPGGQELWLSSSRKAGRLHYYDFLTDRLMKLPLRRSAELLHFRQFSFSPNDRYACGTGQHNLVHLLDTDSKEVLFDFKINSNSVATVFSPDSSKVFVHSAEGKVYVFDIRQNGRCLHRFVDEGCIQGTALAVSANRQYFACGSESGIVNVYDYDTVLQSREPTPIKRATHLLTAVNRIRFNHSTEIMTISSDQADNSIKCLHLPSFNVFADFPRLKTNYGKVTDVAFSPNSHYFAFANDAGKSYLNRLLSFDKY